jgi:subtilisin family serine protease
MEGKNMKRKLFFSLVILAILALTAQAALADKPFSDETSTANGYPTWDADMINIEEVSETGKGVYVAVLDTGMVPYWRDYFPEARVATKLGTGFEQPVIFKQHNEDPCGVEVYIDKLHKTNWVGSTGTTHGTHVASTILGYYYRSNYDALAGYDLPPIMVRGIAPEVTIIPVKVLSDYTIPALPFCTDPGPLPAEHVVFGTDESVAAGIDYVTDLAIAGYRPMVINMSLGGGGLEGVMKTAMDRAIANGVIIVAAAGNEGEVGMHYPGAYPPVISAGAVGWTGEWLYPDTQTERYRMWWLQYFDLPMMPGSGDVFDPPSAEDVYVTDFSSRELEGFDQELDVLAPGSWVRGPYPGLPGYSHLPWWSKGLGDVYGVNPGNFYYVGGTSMSTPHVAAAAALLLEKSPALVQAEIEAILKASALPIEPNGSRTIYNFDKWADMPWDTDCEGVPCDPVGSGLLQVEAALSLLP